jgi:phosphoenolpyruvate carboxykinase (ATP)
MLNTKSTWRDPEAYNQTANRLARLFAVNFEKYAFYASDETKAAVPRTLTTAAQTNAL